MRMAVPSLGIDVQESGVMMRNTHQHLEYKQSAAGLSDISCRVSSNALRRKSI